jgi:hypothetical protein
MFFPGVKFVYFLKRGKSPRPKKKLHEKGVHENLSKARELLPHSEI